MTLRTFKFLLLALLTALLLAGCAAQEAFRASKDRFAEGRVEDGFSQLQEALRLEPNNAEFRSYFIQTRDRLVNGWLREADLARQAGKPDDASTLYQRALSLDAQNTRALGGLRALDVDKRVSVWLTEAEQAIDKKDWRVAELRLREAQALEPQNRRLRTLQQRLTEATRRPPPQTALDASLRRPITLEFKDAPLRQVFEVISRTSGLNFVFDKDIRTDQRINVFMRNTTIQDAVNQLMVTNQLEQRVLDATSILIYPNNAAKAREYQPLVIRSFYLANSDAKTVATTIRTLLKTRDIVTDDKLNMIVMRDTPESVRLAERLIAMHDVQEPEVMLEVEVMEVSRTRLMQLGVRFPDSLTFTPLANAAGNVTVESLRQINQAAIGVTGASLGLAARKTDSDSNLLANPRIRVKNREKANILIGDRVPNVTTTSTATGFIAESIQYVDVGLKLDVEPIIQVDGEVTIRIKLEVSSISNTFTTRSGTTAYQIGTRTASTVLKLKDGENQVLAGLIADEDRRSANRLPGLGDIPLIGRLFAQQTDDSRKNEIVLSITPRILRNIPRSELVNTEIDAGTEASLKNRDPDPVAARPAGVPGQPGVAPASGAPGAPQPSGEAPPAPVNNPAPPAAPGATTLSWQGPQQARVGQAITVALMIQPGEAMTGAPLSIGFDPKLLQVTAIGEGNLLKQGNGQTNYSSRVDPGTGQVFATVTRTSPEGASAPGSLVTLTLRPLAPGGAMVQVLSFAGIGLGGRAVQAALPQPYQLQIAP